MTLARDDYQNYFDQKLWQWIPAIYRELDALQGGDSLHAFTRSLARQAVFLKRNQDRLWEDGYPELASDWAIPYIARLVATRLVSALNLRARRVDVAKTIYYRRRKGTLVVLEQLISDMTGWDGKVVEEFRRLARAHHGLDGLPRVGRLTHTPEGGFADLHSVRGSRLTGDAFDEFHYTPDARRPQGLTGRRGIQKLSFHEFRLHPVHFVRVQPRLVNDLPGTLDGFTFDPSGRDVALFSTDRSHPSGVRAADAGTDWSDWRPASEWQLARPIPCRLLAEAIYEIGAAQIAWIRSTPLIATQAQRDAAADDLRRIAGSRFVGRNALLRSLRALPNAAITGLAGVSAELLLRALVPDCGSSALLPNGSDIASWPGPIVPEESSIDEPAIAVRFVGNDPIARSVTRAANLETWTLPAGVAGPLFIEPRRGRFLLDHPGADPATVRVDYHFGLLAPIGAGAFARDVDGGAATTIWQNSAFGTGTPANGIAEIADSMNYTDPPNQAAVVDCTVRAAEQQRPYLILNANDWRFTAAAADAQLHLDGLWVGARQARVIQLNGNFERVSLRFSTLDPGGTDAMSGALPAVALIATGFVEKLVIDGCILASIAVIGAAASIENIIIRDSIVHSRTAGTVPINVPSASVRMARTTVIAPAIDAIAVRVEELDATDSLIAGVTKVANTQAGCFRFSARAPDSIVPHPYHSYIVDDMARLFASMRFGDYRYAQLSPVAPAEIVRGAENGTETGAFASALVPIKQDSLLAKLDEYMPFGRLPNFIVET